jgi:putative RNA 2'-phosphotransferase
VEKQLSKLSKLMSLILRHKPEEVGIVLDDQGWADVKDLIAGINQHGTSCDRNLIVRVVENSDKQRFAFNPDKSKIRANQGHSIAIDLALTSQQPPDILFHGTATKFLESIQEKGLVAGDRQYVHLSIDKETSRTVGMRHGQAAVLQVNTRLMHQEGFIFFLSENGVWLTEYVPTKYLNGLVD